MHDVTCGYFLDGLLARGRTGRIGCGSPERRKAELKFLESKLKLYMPPTRQLVKSFYKMYFLHVVLLFMTITSCCDKHVT